MQPEKSLITPSCRLYGLTLADYQKIEELRQKLRLYKEVSYDVETDSELSRWLQVTKWNVSDALKMFTSHIYWKDISMASQLMNSNSEQIEAVGKMITRVIFGQDLQGRPVIYFFVSKSKYLELAKLLPNDFLIIAMLVKAKDSTSICEKLSLKQEKLIDQYTNVIDLEGFNFKIVKESAIIKQMAAATHCNFPDSAHQILIINGPAAVLKPAYELVKPFLAESTRKKIKFLKDVRDLQEFISKEEIPERYFGLNSNPYDFDYSFPENILSDFEQVSEEICKTNQMNQINVAPKSLYYLPLVNDECLKGTIITFKFCTTKDYLIFEIAYSPNLNENPIAVHPFLKSNTHQIIHKRSYVCPRNGFYYLAIDNTNNIMMKRRINFKIISIQKPDLKN